jgi:tRNA A-37 threonylcarbamoyl transferase component Bud32/WD40 repeat protein
MSEITDRLTPAIADRYRIEGELGQGGMAIVFRAQDMKHDRKVALKVLRPELAAVIGAERFLNEIKVTANLQHPHILPLHDSGEADSFLFYVMPYVEGDTLRDKLDKEKQLGLEDAIEITRSLAAALDYAHRQGVIHRDIKPENVLLHDGQALIADFGIALAISAAAGGTRLTETGLSIGTPQYMSPEQAMGDRELDARSDVYSLGAMLYEMLAGDPPYTGSTAQAIVAKVITEKAPPVSAARDTVPPHVAMAIDKALSKLPADRFATAVAFAEALSNPAFSAALPQAREAAGERSLWNPVSIGASAVALLAIGLAAWLGTRPEPAARVARFILVPDTAAAPVYRGPGTPNRLALTPDGSELIYMGDVEDDGQPNMLYRRPFDQLRAIPIPGTEHGIFPKASPDGQRVAFLEGRGQPWPLKIASLLGGPPITVVDSTGWIDYGWGPDNTLYLVNNRTATILRLLPGEDGLEEVVTLQAGEEGSRFWDPTILPNGKGAIATVTSANANEHWEYQVHLFDLATGESRGAVVGQYGLYARSGHLVYVTAEGTLMAAPMDLDPLRLTGPAVAILDGLDARTSGGTDVALANDGTLVYSTTGVNTAERVVWASPDGVTVPLDSSWTRDEEFEGLALSPDGRRLAVVIGDNTRVDIWIKQLDRGPLTRLTFDGGGNYNPVWTPDGLSVTYVSNRGGRPEIWTRRADGSGEARRLLDLDEEFREVSWTADGTWLVLRTSATDDIWAIRPGVDSAPIPLITSDFEARGPVVSPDGRWLAYHSDESGDEQVYLRPFPDVEQGRWQLSTDGGTFPMWSADGRYLYYGSEGQSLVQLDMTSGPAAASVTARVTMPPQNEYEWNGGNVMYAVAPDGRFIVIERTGKGDISGNLVLVQNFFEELKTKVGK